MKLDKVRKLRAGDKVRLKDSREKFKYSLDKSDDDLVPGKVIVVEQIDIGDHTDLQILGHYEYSGKTAELWVNHKSVEEYEDELPSSS